MRSSRNAVFTVALTALLVAVGAEAHAQQTLYDVTRDLVTGNLGFFIGLILAVWGIWTWVVKQETTAGILMIIGGVLITVAPGVMNFFGGTVNNLLTTFGADNLTAVQGARESDDILGIGSGQ
jgi:peptidoglycan/LPS O-acetylase OafA/YrhL